MSVDHLDLELMFYINWFNKVFKNAGPELHCLYLNHMRLFFFSLSLFFCFELWLSDFLLGCWFHKMVLGFAYDSHYLRWLGNMEIELKSPTSYYR